MFASAFVTRSSGAREASLACAGEAIARNEQRVVRVSIAIVRVAALTRAQTECFTIRPSYITRGDTATFVVYSGLAGKASFALACTTRALNVVVVYTDALTFPLLLTRSWRRNRSRRVACKLSVG